MRRPGRTTSIALVLLTVALGLPALAWPAASFDELVLLVDPLRMLHGDAPYRDFSTAYGPMHWWLLEGVYALTAPTVLVARLVGLTVHVALVLGTHRLLLPLGARRAATGAAVAAVLLFPLGDAPYAWLTAVALCLWGFLLLQSDRVVLGGALLALAVGMRPDVALLAVVPALPLLRGRRCWRSWVIGLALGSLPLALSAAQAPGGFVRDVLLDRVGRAGRQSRLPLWPAESDQRVLLLTLLVAVLATALAAWLVRTPLLVALALLAALTLPEALQRVDGAHLLYAAALCLPALPAVTGNLLTHVHRPAALGSVLGLVLALVGLTDIALRPVVLVVAGFGPQHATVTHAGRSLPIPTAHAARLRRLAAALDGLSGTLFVYDADLVRPEVTDLSVYYLWPGFAQHAHNVDVTPGVSNAPRSRLDADVAQADVVVLVVTPGYVRADLFPFARDGATAATRTLARLFVLTEQVDDFQVWIRRRA